MIEEDTVKLLRECDAGVKMGVASIDDTLGYVHSPELKRCLTQCKKEHETLKGKFRVCCTDTTTKEKISTPLPKACPG